MYLVELYYTTFEDSPLSIILAFQWCNENVLREFEAIACISFFNATSNLVILLELDKVAMC